MSSTLPAQESPLFSRLHDLTLWLIPCVEKFPKSQRFLLGSRLLDSVFACHAELVRARKVSGAMRSEAQLQADIHLETLRQQLRLAHELGCLSVSQYGYGAGVLNEVGKLLGSWRK